LRHANLLAARQRLSVPAGGWLAGAVWLACQLPCAAAPVTDSAGADAAAAAADGAAGGAPSGWRAGARPSDGAARAGSGMSTGNKNLDLLLDMQGRDGRQTLGGAQSEAAAARAADDARAARARLQALGQPAAGPNGLAGLGGEPLKPQPPATRSGGVPEKMPQREWIPPPAGTGTGSGLGGALSGLMSAGPGAPEAADDRLRRFDHDAQPSDNDSLLRLLPADVRAFLRDNRYALVAGAVLVALAGGIGMLYSRRV